MMMDKDSEASQPLHTSVEASKNSSIDTHLLTSSQSVNALVGRPIVIGATLMDVTMQMEADGFQMNGSIYPGHVCQSFGGVGRNLADCLSRLGTKPIFLSVVGCDCNSEKFFETSKHMDIKAVKRSQSETTAIDCVILDSSGEVLFGVCDMAINNTFGVNEVASFEYDITRAPIVILDSNFSTQIISFVASICSEADVPVWFEPTDIGIAGKPFESDAWKKLTIISPNFRELRVMWKALKDKIRQSNPTSASESDGCEDCSGPPDTMGISDFINESMMMCRDLVTWVPVIVVTLGRHGALLCHAYPNLSLVGLKELKKRPKTPSFHASFFPAVGEQIEKPARPILSTSGAGDCLSAGVLAGLLQGKSFDASMQLGIMAATFSVRSISAVPDTITSISVSAEAAEGWGRVGGREVTEGWSSVNEGDENGL